MLSALKLGKFRLMNKSVSNIAADTTADHTTGRCRRDHFAARCRRVGRRALIGLSSRKRGPSTNWRRCSPLVDGA